MLYQSYKEKLEKRRRVFERVWRLRAFILLGVLLLLAAVGALMGVKGIVYGEIVPDIGEYGSPMNLSAQAVFGSASFEYRPIGTEEWTDEQPIFAGKYECRAVSRSIVGTKTSGEIRSFEILPAECEIIIENDKLIYGDDPVFIASMKYDDVLNVNSFSAEKEEDGKVRISIDTDAVTALSKDGRDATLSYEFRSYDKRVLDVLRSITVETATTEFTYDGAPHSDNGVEITSARGLAKGHKIEVETPSFTEAGVGENSVNSLKIYDADGNEVTDRYSVKKNFGRITVQKRRITVSTSTLSTEYDGTDKTFDDCSIKEGTLVGGHRIVATGALIANDAGTYDNVRNISVFDGDRDVTENYALSTDFGKITVTKKKISVKTLPYEFTYDGAEHSYGAESISLSSGELAEGHSLCVTAVKSVVDADEDGYLNDIGFEIKNAVGENVKNNYEITENFGKIIVHRRRAYLSASAKEYEYNGSAQGYDKDEYILDPPSAELFVGLAEGHTFKVISPFTAVNAGKYKNTPVYSVIDAHYDDVTENYLFEENFGDLEITRLEIAFVSSSDRFEYDGKPHVPSECLPADGYSLVDGHTVSASFADFVNVGDYDDAPVKVTIMDGVEDVTENYSVVSWECGTLKITPRVISVKTESGEWVYDGALHAVAEIQPENIADGQRFAFEAQNVPEQRDVGERDNIFDFDWKVYDGATEVTANYSLPKEEISYGKIKITSRSLYLSTADNLFEYDGTAHSHGVAEAKNVAGGERFDYKITSSLVSLTEVGEVSNRFDFTYEIYDADGNQTTSNYSPSEVEYGLLSVVKRSVTIQTGSLSDVVYDGEAHSAAEYKIISANGLVEGHTLSLGYPSFIEVGTHKNSPLPDWKITDVGGEEISSDNYELNIVSGTIDIVKRPVTFLTDPIETVYDGKPHRTENFVLAEYSLPLVSGHTAQIEFSEWTDSGVYPNLPVSKRIVAADGGDMTLNYTINVVSGAVTISKRPITIITGSDSVVYDGSDHSVSMYGVKEELGLVLGHNLSKATFPVFNKVGRHINRVYGDLNIYDSYDRVVTDNYEILDWQYGILEITPRSITVRTVDVEPWTYDATCHLTAENAIQIEYYNGDSVGHTVVPTFAEMVTDAGIYDNICTVAVEDADGYDVTYCYDITLVCEGKITINKRQASFTTYGVLSQYFNEAEWVYDGAEHSYGPYSNSTLPSFKDENGVLVNHVFSWTEITKVREITDSPTEVGYVDNVFKNLKIIERRVGSDAAIDRTYNYILTCNWGKLRVKSPIVINVATATKEYDGEPLTLTDDDWFIERKPPDTLAENISITLKGSLTYPGQVTLSSVYANSTRKVVNEKIYRVDFTGDPVTLKVVERRLRITTASIVAACDGQPLYGENAAHPYWFSYGSLLANHRLENFKVTGVLLPEEHTALNTVSDFRIVDNNGANVTPFYNINIVYGTLAWSDDS